jgi:Arc/MetJ-type ribon-helix-helix transcriptional regulator
VGMNVVLPADLERYVESLVKKGRSTASSDVIGEALRQHQVNQPGFEIVMTPKLEKLLDEGMEDLEQASTTDQLRQRR